MAPRNNLPTIAQKHVQRAILEIDDVAETIAYCLNSKITPEERNAKLALALNDVRVSQRRLDMALNPNGIYEEPEL